MGNSDIEDSLGKLDKLTQEEARMVQAEQLKVTHSTHEKLTDVDKGFKGVDETVKDIDGEVRNARSDMQDVSSKAERIVVSVQSVQDDVKEVASSMRIACSDVVKDISSKVRDVGDKLDQVNRSFSLNLTLIIPRAQAYLQGTYLEKSFHNGYRLQIHPSIITLHVKLILVIHLNGSFKEESSISGNRRAPYYGYMENVGYS